MLFDIIFQVLLENSINLINWTQTTRDQDYGNTFSNAFPYLFFAFTTIFGKYVLIDTEDKAKGKEDQHKVANESRKYVSVMLISKYGNIHHNNNIFSFYIYFFIYIYKFGIDAIVCTL